MIRVTRTELNKTLSSMNIFQHTKPVIAEYKAQAEKLDDKEKQLQDKLAESQHEHTTIVLEKDLTDDVSHQVYLAKQGQQILSEVAVIQTMIEQVQDKKTELKIKFTPLLQEALRKDQQAVATDFNITKTVAYVRFQLLKAIVDLAAEIHNQYTEISPDIYELLGDEKVREVVPHLDYAFHAELFKPPYQEEFAQVISRQDIHSALAGILTHADPNGGNQDE